MKKDSIFVPIALSVAICINSASAQETKLKATKQQVRSSCNAVGGDLVNISRSGSYGCDNTKKGGGKILCNKNGDCTGVNDLNGLARSIGGAGKKVARVVGPLAR